MMLCFFPGAALINENRPMNAYLWKIDYRWRLRTKAGADANALISGAFVLTLELPGVTLWDTVRADPKLNHKDGYAIFEVTEIVKRECLGEVTIPFKN